FAAVGGHAATGDGHARTGTGARDDEHLGDEPAKIFVEVVHERPEAEGGGSGGTGCVSPTTRLTSLDSNRKNRSSSCVGPRSTTPSPGSAFTLRLMSTASPSIRGPWNASR